jgi:hypothetical protein
LAKELLKGKTVFTEEEWARFGIRDLRSNHFIEAGGSYYKPAGAIEDAIYRPWREKSKDWLEALSRGEEIADFREARAFIVKCGEAQLHALKSVEQSVRREAGV